MNSAHDDQWIVTVNEAARALERAKNERRSLTPAEDELLADARRKIASAIESRGLTMGLEEPLSQALAADLARIRELAAAPPAPPARTDAQRLAALLTTPVPDESD